MAQEDDGGSEVDEALEVLRMVFIAHDQASEVEQPREEPFDLPAAVICPEEELRQGSVSKRKSMSIATLPVQCPSFRNFRLRLLMEQERSTGRAD